MVVTSKESEPKINHMTAAGDFNGNVPDLQVFMTSFCQRTGLEKYMGQVL
jgi:hypothetical protein